MNKNSMYLLQILQQYRARNLTYYSQELNQLKITLAKWANGCYINILDSGSHAKGTAISLASDVDYLISLTSGCNVNNGGLKGIYSSLYSKLSRCYLNVRKQNVSVRIAIRDLEVDITPARKQPGNTNDHSLWLSKQDTWQQTNIHKHIIEISNSGRTNEIKLLKIWRERHQLDFPSIYLEYLLIKSILINKPKASAEAILENNFWSILLELAKDLSNPLFVKITDPANSNNILSDLLSTAEKYKIIAQAKQAVSQQYWQSVIW
jgi:hypothetical protein